MGSKTHLIIQKPTSQMSWSICSNRYQTIISKLIQLYNNIFTNDKFYCLALISIHCLEQNRYFIPVQKKIQMF